MMTHSCHSLHRLFFLGFLLAAFSADAMAQGAAPQLECLVTKSKKTRIEGGDYDDKTQRVAFDINVINKSMSGTTGPLQAVFYSFGESVHDRKAFKLLQKDVFDFDLAPRGSVNHTTPEIELKFDTTNASFGEKYKGWVLLVTDGEGKTVFEQKSSVFIAEATNLPNLKIGDFCNKNAEPIPAPARR
ncbi:MAG: hypothetical protein IAE97_02005 [Chthoniobacterales bacterium]|nr:hypothetical protein [Chthoniobacterales bacterium]